MSDEAEQFWIVIVSESFVTDVTIHHYYVRGTKKQAEIFAQLNPYRGRFDYYAWKVIPVAPSTKVVDLDKELGR